MNEVYTTLSRAIEWKKNAALATVISAKSGTPVIPGAKILMVTDGEIIGTVGGGKLEAAILQDCKLALKEKSSRKCHYSLTEQGKDALGMICGGEVEVFIDVIKRAPELVIIGGGHVGKALQKIALDTGFDVRVVDVNNQRSTGVELEKIEFADHSHVVIMTSDYVSDETALRYVINFDITYIGMIASRTKSSIILRNLKDDGIAEEKLEKVHTPIGLDLGGKTPQEVAVSILAEIIAVRNHGKILKKSV